MYINKYNEWLNSDFIDETTKEELRSINDKDIEERFYKDLEFGTGGLRGIIGAGTNRMNKYTVRRATQGLANKLVKDSSKNSVAIAYDSRFMSKEFAFEAAGVLCGNNIRTYVYEDLRTTPELSFAVRHLGCTAGIVITASHNPKEYNGYKVYGNDGCQLLPNEAQLVIDEVNKIDGYEKINLLTKEEAFNKELLSIIGKDIDDIYMEKVKNTALRVNNVDKDISVIYTPLHGTGNIPVRRVLKELGYSNVHVVKEQELPDSNFITVKSPNPEEKSAFKLAIELGDKINADILLATDPDCDRVGVIVRDDKDEFRILNGNQTGALLMDYILTTLKEKNELPENGVVIKTIVTSNMGRAIAKSFGVETLDTLTGFKFIGEKIGEFERDGSKKFLFGYEESYGYLADTFVRDKDAVMTSMLICEMAGYYKQQGIDLYKALMNLYKKYGYYKEELISISMSGKAGMENIKSIINDLRSNPPTIIGNKEVELFADYKTSKTTNLIRNTEEDISLPKSNVLHFTLKDGSWFCIRPSGTEPKIKIYISVRGNEMESVNKDLLGIKEDIMSLVDMN